MGLSSPTNPTGKSGTMYMPDKPETWAAILGWLQQHWPTIYGSGLGCLVAALRVIYDGGSGRQMVLEGLLCGALTLAVSAALEWLQLPASLAPFFGGFIGLLGVEGVRRLATTYVTKRMGQP
jgi:lambda family phage holin